MRSMTYTTHIGDRAQRALAERVIALADDCGIAPQEVVVTTRQGTHWITGDVVLYYTVRTDDSRAFECGNLALATGEGIYSD